MLRRMVDTTIPACAAIGTVPVFTRIIDLPMALERSLGEAAGIVWCVVVGSAMITVCIGIWLRFPRPSLSIKFEYPALVIAGLISTIYGVTILALGGWRGWTPAWFVWGIGVHCVARFVELAFARRAAKTTQAAA